jgi:acyl phosphate:glycerol-3-phosphate acyltransferase
MGENFSALFVHWQTYFCLIGAYLLGSIPTSYVIGKVFYHQDIRQTGSGNTGATNALRAFGAKTGIIVLLFDMLKGVLAVLLTQTIMKNVTDTANVNIMVSLCALLVIVGHVFSVWLRFQGGKGVATAAGVFLALHPVPFLYCLVLFIFVVYTTKYVSLASLLAAFAFLLIDLFTQIIMKFPNPSRFILIVLVVALIVYRHKANLRRLLDGNENKISFHKTRLA